MLTERIHRTHTFLFPTATSIMRTMVCFRKDHVTWASWIWKRARQGSSVQLIRTMRMLMEVFPPKSLRTRCKIQSLKSTPWAQIDLRLTPWTTACLTLLQCHEHYVKLKTTSCLRNIWIDTLINKRTKWICKAHPILEEWASPGWTSHLP